MGDPSLDLKLGLPRAQDATLGVALLGRVIAPLGDERAQVGQPGWGAEAGLATDLALGPVQAALNLVARMGEPAALGGVDFGQGGVYRLGVAWQASPRLDLSLEAFGQQSWSALLRFDSAPSAELLAAGALALPSGLRMRAGLGRGMASGPGSPDLRAVLGLQLSPPAAR